MANKRVSYTRVITKSKYGDWFLAIKNPVTKDILHVSINQSDEDLSKNLRRLPIPEREITDYFTHKNNRFADGRCKTFSKVVLVRITKGLSDVEGFGVLTHELLHATFRMLEYWEKKLKFENKEEVMCCVLNFYFEQVINATLAAIDIYGDKKLGSRDTYFLSHNYSLHKKKK